MWCRLPSGQWESGVIQSTSGECAFVSLSNGNVSSSVLVISGNRVAIVSSLYNLGISFDGVLYLYIVVLLCRL